MFSWIRAMDPGGIYPRAPDQPPWSRVFEDCLSGRAFDGGKRADHLYAAGYGKRSSGHDPDPLQAGAVKCSAADSDEYGIRPLRHDLDPACD